MRYSSLLSSTEVTEVVARLGAFKYGGRGRGSRDKMHVSMCWCLQEAYGGWRLAADGINRFTFRCSLFTDGLKSCFGGRGVVGGAERASVKTLIVAAH